MTRAVPYAIAAALVLLQAVVLVFQLRDALHANLAAMLVQNLVFAAAAILVLRGRMSAPLPLVLGTAVLLRLMALGPEPYHSTDIYRYVWDGRVQGAGINPYRHLPVDPALAPLRDEAVFPRINRADYAPTIYPPAAQAVFALVGLVSSSVLALKTAFLLLDLATIWGLSRLLAREGAKADRILLYAWCPLPVWEFVGAGHVDAAMTAFVVLTLLALRTGRRALGGAAFALAVLTKFLPALLAPALWRRSDPRFPLAGLAIVALAYLPYLGAGLGVFGFLPGYAGEEGLRDGSGFWLLRLLRLATGLQVPTLAYLAGTAVALLGWAFLVAPQTRFSDPLSRAAILATAGLVALSPIYPWYFGWLVAFFCLRPSVAVLWLATAAPLLYWDDPRLMPWSSHVVYGGFFAVLALGALWRARLLLPVRRPA